MSIYGVDYGSPLYGSGYYYKIGRTTGMTYGGVAQSCVTMAVPDWSTHNLLCQYKMSGGADQGDSGAPVIRYDDLLNDRWMTGIVWGKTWQGLDWLMSPMSGVYYDMHSVY